MLHCRPDRLLFLPSAHMESNNTVEMTKGRQAQPASSKPALIHRRRCQIELHHLRLRRRGRQGAAHGEAAQRSATHGNVVPGGQHLSRLYPFSFREVITIGRPPYSFILSSAAVHQRGAGRICDRPRRRRCSSRVPNNPALQCRGNDQRPPA